MWDSIRKSPPLITHVSCFFLGAIGTFLSLQPTETFHKNAELALQWSAVPASTLESYADGQLIGLVRKTVETGMERFCRPDRMIWRVQKDPNEPAILTGKTPAMHSVLFPTPNEWKTKFQFVLAAQAKGLPPCGASRGEGMLYAAP